MMSKGFASLDIVDVEQAEALTAMFTEYTSKTDSMAKDLNETCLKADLNIKESNATKLYKPVMYFVDKEYEAVPTTCGGTLLNSPILAETEAGCAKACEESFKD